MEDLQAISFVLHKENQEVIWLSATNVYAWQKPLYQQII